MLTRLKDLEREMEVSYFWKLYKF